MPSGRQPRAQLLLNSLYDEVSMHVSAPSARLLLGAGTWLGVIAGSALGILFLFITATEVRHGNEPATFVAFLLPLLVAAGGALAGRFCYRRIAGALIATDHFLMRVAAGAALGTLAGIVVLVLQGETMFLLKHWSGQLDFRGGVPAILENAFIMFGFLGALFGGALGLAFGLFGAIALRPRRG